MEERILIVEDNKALAKLVSKKVQDALNDKKITAGHAKMLVGLDEKNQTLMLNSIIGQKLSVREVENIIKSLKKSDIKEEISFHKQTVARIINIEKS